MMLAKTYRVLFLTVLYCAVSEEYYPVYEKPAVPPLFIGIGIAVLALTIAVILVIIVRRRKKKENVV